jgi:hypothetical protein
MILFRRQRFCCHPDTYRDGADEAHCLVCKLYLGYGSNVPAWLLERERDAYEREWAAGLRPRDDLGP